MSDFLKSAFNYIGSSDVNCENGFVGREVQINGKKLRVKKIIAEGGFAFVYVAQDIQNGKLYALKKLIGSDQAACNSISLEIQITKQLSGHPYITEFYGVSVIDKCQSSVGKNEYLLLTELCTGGSLLDSLRLLNGATLSVDQVVCIMYQTAKAVQHMQAQNPCITHRDLKIENLLIGESGHIKLCDFGSAMIKSYEIDSGWSANQRGLLEDEMATNTTPMYRAPEMLDTWNNYPINCQADIWALGCILYYLCYLKHPFEDSAKLRIVNGNFSIPPNDGKYECFHDLMRGMLRVDPTERLKICEVLERLAAIAETKGFDMKGPLKLATKPIDVSTPVHQPQHSATFGRGGANVGPPGRPPPPSRPDLNAVGSSQSASQPPQRPLPPRQHGPPQSNNSGPAPVAGGGGGGGLFSSLKGYSGSIFKNIKDTSSKVMQTVSQSISRTDLDLHYITSRIIAMSFPAEGLESAYRNHIEDVRSVLESHHATHYVVYNVSGRQYPSSKFNVHVIEGNWQGKKAPTLGGLYNLSVNVHDNLGRNPKSAVVIHCMDGKASTAMLVCSFLIIIHLFSRAEQALNMFAIKRVPPDLQPSQFRYLRYIESISASSPVFPHFKPVTITSVTFSPIPVFTQKRDGVRPYVEIFQGEHKALSTLQNYESLRLFSLHDSKVTIPVNIHMVGDVCVYIFHARRIMGKVVGIKVAQIQFHTGFIPEEETSLRFTLDELDDITEVDRYPQSFLLVVNLLVSDVERAPPQPPPWVTRGNSFRPIIAFSSTLEMEETKDKFASVAPASPAARRETHFQKPPNECVSTALSSSDVQNLQEEQSSRINDKNYSDDDDDDDDDALVMNFDGPTHSGITQEADLLNWTPQKETGELASDVDLLNISLGEDHVKDASSNFDLLSGMGNPSQNQSAAHKTIFDPLASKDNKSLAQKQASPQVPDFLCQFDSPQNDPTPVKPSLNPSSSTPLISADGCLIGGGKSSPISGPAVTSQCTPAQPQTKVPLDPFADLGNLSGISGWSSSKSATPMGGTPIGGTPRGGSTPNLASPQHQNSSWSANNASRITPSAMMGGGSSCGVASPTWTPQQPNAPQCKSPTGTPHHRMRSPNGPPNYGRTYFDTAKGPTSQGKAKSDNDAFGDLLGSQGFTFSSSKDTGPKTIGEMKKEEITKNMDPEKVLVLEWSEGKKRNIRALLCSLHTILWEGAKWSECGMHQLVHHSDVKKMYRRACLAVHPDKLAGSEHESLAKLIFFELNEAYSEFEDDPNQSQIFK